MNLLRELSFVVPPLWLVDPLQPYAVRFLACRSRSFGSLDQSHWATLKKKAKVRTLISQS